MNKFVAYMCGTDWDTEIPMANRYMAKTMPEFYKSQAALKRDRRCWRECGIYEVEVKFKRVVRKGSAL